MSEYALAVLGAGSYGTSLAVAVASKGVKVKLWGRNAQSIAEMCKTRQNAKYLKDILFPPTLEPTASLQEAVTSADILLMVVPSHTFSGMLKAIAPYLRPAHRLFWATKGIDPESGDLLSNVARKILPANMPLAAISGPTFAMELARGLPTAIAVAGTDKNFIHDIAELMHTPTFRIYGSDDFLALQLGGTIKNVIAIACGLSDGMGFGANARTALISRGLAEMIRFGVTLGATDRGFQGLSGLGDLILTCTDNQSRNRRFGYMIGKGFTVTESLKEIGQVVEGYTMTAVLKKLQDRHEASMPICSELYEVLYRGKSGQAAAVSLLSREQKSE